MRSCTPFPTGLRLRASVFAVAIVVPLVSCEDNQESPTAPALEATTTSTSLSFRQVSAGRAHSCGVTTDNRAFCWGAGYRGQRGDGTTIRDRFVPVAVKGGHAFRQVSAGYDHTCGVTTTNQAFCWGWNVGSLGDGTTMDRSVPVRVAGGLQFREVTGGLFHSCGVTVQGRAYCWGDNHAGQLGNGTTTRRLTPIAVAGARTFRALSAGADHTCGVTSADDAFCWGVNNYGQIGDGSQTARRVWPTRVAGGHKFRQVSGGEGHTCGVTTVARAFCWGYGQYGQIGDGKTSNRFTPQAVAGGRSFSHVSGGGRHTCGVTTQNRAYCWGENFGTLGDGTSTRRLTPSAVAGGIRFRQVDAGYGHICGVNPDNRAYCWGSDYYGQRGDGSPATFGVLVPTPVRGPN